MYAANAQSPIANGVYSSIDFPDESTRCVGLPPTYPYTFGPSKEDQEFILEENIPGIEIGYDGFSVDGQFPMSEMMWGVEVKDCGYCGVVVPTIDAPEPITETNERLSETMKAYTYRGFFSDALISRSYDHSRSV